MQYVRDRENHSYKKEKNSKNVLSKGDLEKLTDESQKLIPLKDFWDAKKKHGRSVGGTFGKQNSSPMKRLFGQEKFTYCQSSLCKYV